jgi:hypothetical protein
MAENCAERCANQQRPAGDSDKLALACRQLHRSLPFTGFDTKPVRLVVCCKWVSRRQLYGTRLESKFLFRPAGYGPFRQISQRKQMSAFSQ